MQTLICVERNKSGVVIGFSKAFVRRCYEMLVVMYIHRTRAKLPKFANSENSPKRLGDPPDGGTTLIIETRDQTFN